MEAIVKLATLVYVIEDGKVLMIYGAEPHAPHYELYNGLGGKLSPGESPEVGARREARQEAGIELGELDYVGALRFRGFRKAETDWLVHTYRAYSYTGTPVGNDREGHLRWFSISDVVRIPTCPPDQRFLYWILNGRHFDAEIQYWGELCTYISVHFQD